MIVTTPQTDENAFHSLPECPELSDWQAHVLMRNLEDIRLMFQTLGAAHMRKGAR